MNKKLKLDIKAEIKDDQCVEKLDYKVSVDGVPVTDTAKADAIMKSVVKALQASFE